MAKIWENRNGKCYCYGHLMGDSGCHGANCRTCCYNLGMVSNDNWSTRAEISMFNVSTPGNTPLQYGTDIKDDYISSGFKRITITGNPGAIFSLKSTKTSSTNTTTPTTECEVDVLTDVSMPNNGTFVFNYNFSPSTTINKYDFQLLPGHLTTLGEFIPKTTPTYSINQYPDPVITLTSAASTLSSVTETGADATLTGKIRSTPDVTNEVNKISYTRTISHASSVMYVSKSPKVDIDYTNSLDIKKVVRKVDNTANIEINPFVKSGETTISFDRGRYAEIAAKSTPLTEQEYVKVGMTFEGEVSYTKVFINHIITNINKDCEGCIDYSNKIKLTGTGNIEVGMIMAGIGITANVVSIDSDTDITISKIISPKSLKNGTELTFVKWISGTIIEVRDHFNIVVDSPKTIPNGTVLTFNNNESEISGTIVASGSGSTEITIVGNIFVKKFGKESVTYTQQVDDFVTFTPNAYRQTVRVPKDTATNINVKVGDTDINSASKTVTVLSNPSRGALASLESGIQTYTPHTGFLGDDSFTFKVNDGTTDSATKTINITVTK